LGNPTKSDLRESATETKPLQHPRSKGEKSEVRAHSHAERFAWEVNPACCKSKFFGRTQR